MIRWQTQKAATKKEHGVRDIRSANRSLVTCSCLYKTIHSTTTNFMAYILLLIPPMYALSLSQASLSSPFTLVHVHTYTIDRYSFEPEVQQKSESLFLGQPPARHILLRRIIPCESQFHRDKGSVQQYNSTAVAIPLSTDRQQSRHGGNRL